MAGEELHHNPEAKKERPTSEWTEVFGILKDVAKQKLSDYGRVRFPQKSIDQEAKFEGGLRVRIESRNIDNYLKVIFKTSSDTSLEDEARPAKGINMVWATGRDEAYSKVTFTLTDRVVTAYGKHLTLGGDDVKLDLVDDPKGVQHLETLSKIAIDRGTLPHLM